MRSEFTLTLADMTRLSAEQRPEQTALIDAHRKFTFAELDGATEQLAHLLVRLGVLPGDRVAIFGTKTIDTVVAILATVRAGALYVPIDPNLPDGRHRFVMEDADPKVVLGPSELYRRALGRTYVELDRLATLEDETASQPAAALPRVGSSAAYIMYTSGSTGRPKGVVIEHRGIAAFFAAHNRRAGIKAGDRCLNTGPFHFDVSLIDVFLPLSVGATVVLTPELPMPKALLHKIEAHRITHFYAVGTILGLMTGDGRLLDQYDLSSLQLLQTGAEICNPRVVNQWLTRIPGLRFLNSYGPTEVSVGCTCFVKKEPGLLPLTPVPIGEVHEGTQALLFDGAGEPVMEQCAEGELLVGGEQLMRGYWKRPDEEQMAFVEIAGERFYRTGDIVRRDEHGLLHYVGRRDDELKVHGLRIHLSEVKRSLESHSLIEAAAAGRIHDQHGRARVAAAVIASASLRKEDLEALLDHLRHELPAPAVPAAFLVCDEFPRTATGKVDARFCMELLQRVTRSNTTKVIFLEEELARASTTAELSQSDVAVWSRDPHQLWS